MTGRGLHAPESLTGAEWELLFNQIVLYATGHAANSAVVFGMQRFMSTGLSIQFHAAPLHQKTWKAPPQPKKLA